MKEFMNRSTNSSKYCRYSIGRYLSTNMVKCGFNSLLPFGKPCKKLNNKDYKTAKIEILQKNTLSSLSTL